MNISRFDELLPFYVNGTLGDDDRLFVERWLREHPGADIELRWARSLQQRLQEDAVAVSSEVGLERALQRIRAERPKTARAAAVSPVSPVSPLQRARDWLASLVPQPMRGPALAAALAVVALQGVVIGSLMSEREAWDAVRSPKPSVTAESGPYLKVNFKPDAREADIRLLLIAVQGSLAAGPGQLGDYYVRIPKAQLAAATAALQASAVVEGVSVVDALPGRP
jgi:hypothetical protein